VFHFLLFLPTEPYSETGCRQQAVSKQMCTAGTNFLAYFPYFKEKVLGRTNRPLSFDKTRIA
jgi:hypothetical protein